MTTRRNLSVVACVATLLLAAAAGCGGGDDGGGGTITSDGSSTVGPFTTKAAEDFQAENPEVQIPMSREQVAEQVAKLEEVIG